MHQTHLQEPRIFPLFHTLLYKLQRLLKVLTVNGILYLFVAPLEDGVVGARHHGSGMRGGCSYAANDALLESVGTKAI